MIGFKFVGMTGFEPATPRPPGVAALHPENRSANLLFFHSKQRESWFYSIL